MTKNHSYYLDLAYQLAEKNLGKTGLNPSVGAIVVKDDSVISSGITSYRGRPHAEFNALSKIKNCAGASLYTSLEPCVHWGKTPPCTKIIFKKKIKEVYFGSHDPDIRSYKKSTSILEKKGIEVKTIKPIINEVKTNISLEDRTVPSSAALSNFRWEGSSVLSCELSSSAILKTFLCWRMK